MPNFQYTVNTESEGSVLSMVGHDDHTHVHYCMPVMIILYMAQFVYSLSHVQCMCQTCSARGLYVWIPAQGEKKDRSCLCVKFYTINYVQVHSEASHNCVRMLTCTCSATHWWSKNFIFKKERAISRSRLRFSDVCIPKHQGTWHTYYAVTNKAQEDVPHNNR